MNNKKLLLILIFVLAFMLRFWGLGRYPNSLDWDEASLGYNAYSILKTGRDEYGSFLPLQFRSFGDYKPPFYVYSVIPLLLIGDLTEFTVRFPSALFGFLTVVVTYYLSKRLFPRLDNKYYLLITFLLAISPWHIQFSRIAFEANIGLFWFVLGTYLFLGIPQNKNLLFFSAISFVLGIYTYHSLRLVVPIYVLGLVIIFNKELLKNKKTVVITFILTLIMLSPLIFLMSKGVQARFQSVSSINPESLSSSIGQMEFDTGRGDRLGKLLHNRRIVYATAIIKGYLDHWDPSFLFLAGDGPGRHHAPDMGMLYFIELPFILIGIFYLLFNKEIFIGKKVVFWWFLIAPLASAVTTGTPHAVRALLYLPMYQIFTAFGIKYLIDFSYKKKYQYLQLTTMLITTLYLFNFIYYLDMYYVHGGVEQAPSWQYGYREAVREVSRLESSYDNIIITYEYDQPYIYFLFYQKIDPSWYQKNWGDGEIKRSERSFGKYTFRDIKWEKDKELKNTLLVGTTGEIPDTSGNLIKEISYPDGNIAFRIVSLK